MELELETSQLRFQNLQSLNGCALQNIVYKKKQQFESQYKDLQNRCQLLTIYRDIQDQNSNEEDLQKKMFQSINQNITSLSDYYTQILAKNEKYALSEKPSIKNILTSLTYNRRFSESKQLEVNHPFQKYVFEALEKQAEGIINNALIMIQPQVENPNFNEFSRAIAYQVQESKKICNKEDTRGNKVVFINLSRTESSDNLLEWNRIMKKDDDYLYFSFVKIEKDGKNIKDSYQKKFEEMKDPGCKQFILPYVCDTEDGKLFKGSYLQTLFDLFLYIKIQKIAYLGYIALSLEISDDIEYELIGLQYLIQNLMRLSNNKLIVHLNVRKNINDNDFEIKLAQVMNQCYQSFLNRYTEGYISANDRYLLTKYLEQTNYWYHQFGLGEWSESLLHSKRSAILCSLQDKIFQQQQKYNAKVEQQAIFYKKNDSEIAIIIPKIGNKTITQFTEIKVDYKDNIIIIYQNLSHENKATFLYYAYFRDEYFRRKNIKIELQFTEINLQYEGIIELSHPVLFYQNHIINVLYGLRSDSKINEYLYQYPIEVGSWKKLTFEGDTKPTQFFSQKIYYQNIDRNTYFNKIKYRTGVAVCFDPVSMCPILFGGENFKKPQIMNQVECIEISSNCYRSGLIQKEQIYKDLSFKPFPKQIILQAENEQEKYFLFLPGNDNLRMKKDNHITNQSIANTVVVLKKLSNDTQISKLTINYQDKDFFPLNQMNNKQQNIQFIKKIQNLFVWRIIFVESITDESKYEKLAKLQVYVEAPEQQGDLICEQEVIQQYLKQNNLQNQENEFVPQKKDRNSFQLQQCSMITEKQDHQKYTNLKFTLACENYLFFDFKAQSISVKQFQYQILDPIQSLLRDIPEETNQIISLENTNSAIFINQNKFTNSVYDITHSIGFTNNSQQYSRVQL